MTSPMPPVSSLTLSRASRAVQLVSESSLAMKLDRMKLVILHQLCFGSKVKLLLNTKDPYKQPTSLFRAGLLQLEHERAEMNGYDAWLEEPYQNACKAQEAYDKAEESYIDSDCYWADYEDWSSAMLDNDTVNDWEKTDDYERCVEKFQATIEGGE